MPVTPRERLVPWSGGCGCELCGTLGGFLTDRGERRLEWPLAEARRKHVKDQISAAELPVKDRSRPGSAGWSCLYPRPGQAAGSARAISSRLPRRR